MRYFMTELEATDWQAAVGWYRDALGLRVVQRDDRNQFALLAAEHGGQIAIKGAEPARTRNGVRLVFEVADLDGLIGDLNQRAIPFDGPRTSGEGYREIRLRDPDGTRIGVFAWVKPHSQIPG